MDCATARAMAAQVGVPTVYASHSNGRGPLAWDHHWLLVPLRDRAGEAARVRVGRRPRRPAAARRRRAACPARVRQPRGRRDRGRAARSSGCASWPSSTRSPGCATAAGSSRGSPDRRDASRARRSATSTTSSASTTRSVTRRATTCCAASPTCCAPARAKTTSPSGSAARSSRSCSRASASARRWPSPSACAPRWRRSSATSRCRSRSPSGSPTAPGERSPRRSCAPPTAPCSPPSASAATAAWSTTRRRSRCSTRWPTTARGEQLAAADAAGRDARPARRRHRPPLGDGGRYAEQIALELGLPPDHVVRVRVAGVLHDIGKLGISDAVLLKPGWLGAPEWERDRVPPRARRADPRARQPARRGELGALPPRAHGRRAATRAPGGDDIPLEGRMLAVADAYEAMTADRPYRSALVRRGRARRAAPRRRHAVRPAGGRGVRARARRRRSVELAVVPASRSSTRRNSQPDPLGGLAVGSPRVPRRPARRRRSDARSPHRGRRPFRSRGARRTRP